MARSAGKYRQRQSVVAFRREACPLSNRASVFEPGEGATQVYIEWGAHGFHTSTTRMLTKIAIVIDAARPLIVLAAGDPST